jgi:hypothetical protein
MTNLRNPEKWEAGKSLPFSKCNGEREDEHP